MTLLASSAGRRLEPTGNGGPRGMTAIAPFRGRRNRTRLTGGLRLTSGVRLVPDTCLTPRGDGAHIDEEALNLSIRKFLKMVGVNSQREIEHAVAKALAERRIAGSE